jgi:hypothetical protein
MANYRTAMGKSVDMAALTAKNEKTRAVGNMKVNARGDTIDAHGRVIQTATTKVNNSYNRTVGNRSAQPVRNRPTSAPSTPTVNTSIDLSQLNEIERELEESLEDDLEIEKIKAEEIAKTKTQENKKK